VFADRNGVSIAVVALLIWDFRNVLHVCNMNAVNISGYEVQMMNSNTNKADIP
jgi:hypothetical protein